MNILITGANGFIGRALCNKLIADGYHVRGSVRGAAQMTALPSGVEGAMVGDIGPETDWSEVLNGIEGIVHLAARVHVMRESSADPLAAFREVNVEGTKCLAIAAANAGVKRFVYISSVKVNGEGTGKREDGGRRRETGRKRDQRPTSNIERPTSNEKEELATDPRRLTQTFVRATCSGKNSHRFAKEKAEGRSDPYTEMDKPEPQDPYAVSKWEAEQILAEISSATGIEIVIIRPPLVYGPNVRANFLRLLRWVNKGIPLPLGMVDNRRSLVSLDNLVDFLITCIEHPAAAGETFLVSDGEDLSTPALIRRIALSMNIPARLIPVPVCLLRLGGSLLGKKSEVDRLCGSLQVDISKAKSVLGWKPPLSVDEGLAKTADWCLNDETNF